MVRKSIAFEASSSFCELHYIYYIPEDAIVSISFQIWQIKLQENFIDYHLGFIDTAINRTQSMMTYAILTGEFWCVQLCGVQIDG